MKPNEINATRQRVEKAEALVKEIASLKYISTALRFGRGIRIELVASDTMCSGGKEYYTEHRMEVPYLDNVHAPENADHIRRRLHDFAIQLLYDKEDELREL